MAMLSTYQGAYVPMRAADVTADDTALDGGTATLTFFDVTDKDYYAVGPETNAVEIIFYGEATSEAPFSAKLYGSAPNGPWEFICEITAAASATMYSKKATETDYTTFKLIDDMTIVTQAHIKTVAIKDNANSGRVAKLSFDTIGMDKLYWEFADVGDASEVTQINAYCRSF